jgi:catalase
VNLPLPVDGSKVRASPVSFDDHFTQATMFYRSLTGVEQLHVVEAYTFELGKVYEQAVKERQLAVLANIDTTLCERVAAGLGLPAPVGDPARDVLVSPALSQVVTVPGPISGRKIAVVADASADLAGIDKLRTALEEQGGSLLVLAPIGGTLGAGKHAQTVERTNLTARSIEFDAVVVAGGTTPTGDIKLTVLLQEAFRHCKAMGAWGSGLEILDAAGITADSSGVMHAKSVTKAFATELLAALGVHRAWDRAASVVASAVAPAS